MDAGAHIRNISSGMKEYTQDRVVRRRLALIILDHSGTTESGRSALSQREMAQSLGVTWGDVTRTLQFLQDAGAIRIDRHRMFADNKTLLRIAEGEDEP